MGIISRWNMYAQDAKIMIYIYPYLQHEDMVNIMCISKNWKRIVQALCLGQQTALFHSARCALHRIRGHPERPERVQVVKERIRQCYPYMQDISTVQEATQEQLTQFHTVNHVNAMIKWCLKIEKSMTELQQIHGQEKLQIKGKSFVYIFFLFTFIHFYT